MSDTNPELVGHANLPTSPTDLEGLSKSDLVALVRQATGTAGPTLSEYFDTWSTALDLTPKSCKTYRLAVRPLARGMALEQRVVPPGDAELRVVPWDDERVRAWLTAAERVRRDLRLGLKLPTLKDCQRTDDGSVLLWEGLGDTPLRSLTGTDLKVAASWVRLRAIVHGRTKRSRVRTDGMGAVRGMLSAVRNLYVAAAADGLVPQGTDPTASVKRGRRRQHRHVDTEHVVEHRVTLSEDELVRVRDRWCETGDDPVLDTWLYQYLWHTGSRRAGALELRVGLIDVDEQLIFPPDKDSDASRGVRRTSEAMPVPRPVAEGLVAFARSRGAVDDDDLVFRYSHGGPITSRRFDSIRRRCAELDFVDAMDRFGPHHLRSTAAARIEQHAAVGRSSAVKQRFLRHRPNGQTQVYGQATLAELAAAMTEWTGFEHPLVRQ